jgi:quercetin dioxygenase-like cupin family protein
VTVIRAAESRRSETPNAVMTTLASPTQGGSSHALWRVDMPPRRTGPLHAADAEQIWSVIEGSATAQIGTERTTVEAGDTLVMPAGTLRQVITGDQPFAAVVAAPGGVGVYRDGEQERIEPPWAV